jgi:DNA polymerase III subunit delta'
MNESKFKLNWPLIGNGHIFEFLDKSLANQNIAGSYIFTGPAGLGKATAANFFAQSLVCEVRDRSASPCGQCPACQEAIKGIHSDIYLIKKEADKKNISIEQVRDFIRSLGLSSFLNSYKVGIIDGAEALSDGAVSALLKTLEEPKAKVVIILTVADFEVLPRTIISRSQILRFRPVKSDLIYDDLIKNHGAQRSQAKNFSRLAAGRPALALKFFEDREYYENYQNEVKAFTKFISPDINERFKAVENILGKNTRGQAAVKLAGQIIDSWQNLARDLMFLNLDLADLVQHEAFIGELSAVKAGFNLRSAINFIQILKQAKEYLANNVNPKLTLENVAVSI